ncbi:glycosyltransferase [Sporosarcina trichiuri]|uniref:glycosyltransferase n=1 Tax=Sporosarcina trichiuri TaxID=3056445 RepID=UPI0025B36FA5|nr:glycosyltransferase [Sporosarcina sp. 0.2-SM1T-5]WJY26415.1 glycosyltransferase [Sporosarcina sp. 0.2-SM1T-5]
MGSKMNKKIKLMQIMPEFGLAGAEIMAENLSIALEDDGFDVNVVSLYDYHSAITERLENQNIKVIYLDKKKGFDIKVIFSLYKLFKKEKPEIIHTHRYILPYAMIAAIAAKVPTKVHTIHNIASKETGKFQRKINYFFFKYCGVVPVAISPLVKKSVIREYNFSEEKVPMVYNGIDLAKCIEKKAYNDENKKISILHVGRFSEQKNHSELIENFKIICNEMPNITLKLIGSGHLEKTVKDKVKDLGLENNVEFLGTKANVFPYLNDADIFILPSLWEGMPITLIEAMATGLPIVATNVGGVPDMIEHRVTGLLVNNKREEIVEAVLELIRDSELRNKLGESAKVASKKFSVTNMKAEYVKIYHKTF